MTDTMTEDRVTDVGGIAAERLRSFVERIEREEQVKKEVSDTIKDIYLSAKSDGFDVKVLRQIIRLRKKDREERQEEAELIDLYSAALGME